MTRAPFHIVRHIPWLLSLWLLAACGGRLHAQFNVYYAGTGGEEGWAVHQLTGGTHAGDIVAVGYTDTIIAAQVRVCTYVTVTSVAGARVAAYAIYLPGESRGKDFVEAGGDNIVITGMVTPEGAHGYDIYVLKFDLVNGTVAWAKRYGVSGEDNYDDLPEDIEDVGNGYVIAGSSNSGHALHHDAILFKIDQGGGWQWGKAYDIGPEATVEKFGAVGMLPGGDLVAAGECTAGGNTDLLVVRTKSTGAGVVASRFGGGGTAEGARSLKVCDPLGPNAGTIVVSGSASQSALVGVIDYNTFASLAGRRYDHPNGGRSEAIDVAETPSPEYEFVTTGWCAGRSGLPLDIDIYLSRVSSNLSVVDWYRLHGDTLRDWGNAVAIATGIGLQPYSVIETGQWTTVSGQGELDLARIGSAWTSLCLPNPVSVEWTGEEVDPPGSWGEVLGIISSTVLNAERDPLGPPADDEDPFCE